jgi:hypothetical protein
VKVVNLRAVKTAPNISVMDLKRMPFYFQLAFYSWAIAGVVFLLNMIYEFGKIIGYHAYLH